MRGLASFLYEGGKSVGWLLHLGAFGLVIIGIIDQSFIPIPGGIDMLLILLAASQKEPLVYWAAAMIGALLGAWITYRISKKGGKEALEKRLPKKRIKKVEEAFKKHGFWAMFVSGLLPPPLPMVPFLVGAGALQFPTGRFLGALALSRAIRYGLVVYFARKYGTGIMKVFTAHKWEIIGAFLVFSVGASLIGWWWTKREIARERAENGGHEERPEAA